MFFEVLEDPDFVLKAEVGMGTEESFVNLAVEPDVNCGAFGVFDFLHRGLEGVWLWKGSRANPILRNEVQRLLSLAPVKARG